MCSWWWKTACIQNEQRPLRHQGPFKSDQSLISCIVWGCRHPAPVEVVMVVSLTLLRTHKSVWQMADHGVLVSCLANGTVKSHVMSTSHATERDHLVMTFRWKSCLVKHADFTANLLFQIQLRLKVIHQVMIHSWPNKRGSIWNGYKITML